MNTGGGAGAKLVSTAPEVAGDREAAEVAGDREASAPGGEKPATFPSAQPPQHGTPTQRPRLVSKLQRLPLQCVVHPQSAVGRAPFWRHAKKLTALTVSA